MSDRAADFTGSIPDFYDHGLGPIFFADFADDIARRGFDWVWFLGVWQTGKAGREVSRSDAQCREQYKAALPGFSDEDVSGSPFAIQKYALHADFGNARSLAGLRQRLGKRGLKLLLDFVPNHTALDHPWATAQFGHANQGTPTR